MKANELSSKDLMIGDWADFASELSDPPIAKIINVNDLYMIDNGRMVVRPIPLTPEILKKNGFDNIDNMYPFPTFRCDDKENYLCITIGFPEGDKTKRKYPFIEIDGKNIFVEYLIINFVHELQHALKLCGIEKEIVV